MLTQAELKTQLHYEPSTGVFTRLVSNNTRFLVGTVAGCQHHSGYNHISISKRIYEAHRLAWLYVHGQFPANQLDHKNGQRSDNRLDNLRLATHAQNVQNQVKPSKNNKSGYLGVCWSKSNSAWAAQIKVSGKILQLGRFADPTVAHQIYLAAKRVHHPYGTI